MSHRNEVFVLHEGYSYEVDITHIKANCTSVLIKGKESMIIVDTRTPWDGAALTAGKHR